MCGLVNSLVFQTGDTHVDAGDRRSNMAVLSWMVGQAIEQQAAVFVHAGDAFADGRPSQEAWLGFYQQMCRLVAARIPLVLLEGNHERIGVPASQRTATAVLGEALSGLPSAEVFFAEGQPQLFNTSTGIQVAAFPWLSRTADLYDGLDLRQADAQASVLLEGLMGEMAGRADGGMPLVLASHVSVVGGRAGSEDDLGASRFHEPIVHADMISQAGYNFAGLAHLHTRQHWGDTVWFSGSPNRLTFADADMPKSVNVAQFDGSQLVGVEQLLTPARPMTSIDLTQPQTDFSQILPDALVRLVLPPGDVDVPQWAIDRVEQAGGQVASVKKRPPAIETVARLSLPERIRPQEALTAWLNRENVPVEDQPRLLALADQLLHTTG